MTVRVHPLARTFDIVEPMVPRALVSAAAYAGIRTVGARLPAALTDRIYFECRLGAGALATDLILRVEEEGRDILADANPVIRRPLDLAPREVWSGAADFCRRWRAGDDPVYRHVRRLWLELDFKGATRSADGSLTGFFVDPTASLHQRRHHLEGFRLVE